MPELSLTVTGAPIISLKKPLGSLESPLLSGAGLCDMSARGRCSLEDFSVCKVRLPKRGFRKNPRAMHARVLTYQSEYRGEYVDVVTMKLYCRGERSSASILHGPSCRSRRCDQRDCASIRRTHPASNGPDSMRFTVTPATRFKLRLFMYLR